MVHYVPLPLVWGPLPAELAEESVRLEETLERWKDSPYAPGQCVPGPEGGVDCVRWTVAIAADFRGVEMPPLPDEAQDTAMHDPEKAWEIKRTIRRRIEPVVDVESQMVQPGDFIVSGPVYGGPGHTQFVGFEENTLWHAISPRVCFTGWSMPSQYRLYRILRLKELHIEP